MPSRWRLGLGQVGVLADHLGDRLGAVLAMTCRPARGPRPRWSGRTRTPGGTARPSRATNSKYAAIVAATRCLLSRGRGQRLAHQGRRARRSAGPAGRGRGRACRGSAGTAPAWTPRPVRRSRPWRRRGSPTPTKTSCAASSSWARRADRGRRRPRLRVSGLIDTGVPSGVLARGWRRCGTGAAGAVRETRCSGTIRILRGGNLRVMAWPPLVEPGAGALPRGGRAVRPAPADPRGGPARAAPAQGRPGARRRRRRAGLAGPALPRRGGRGHHRRGRRRRGRGLQPAAPGGPRGGRRRPAQDRLGARTPSPGSTRWSTVVRHDLRLDSGNALELIAGYDLVLDGTDNFATRYLVNDACVLLGKPHVWGSIYRFDGQVSVWWAEHGPATAVSSPSRRRRAWCRRAPRAACWACCARRSGRCRPPRRSSC